MEYLVISPAKLELRVCTAARTRKRRLTITLVNDVLNSSRDSASQVQLLESGDRGLMRPRRSSSNDSSHKRISS